MPAYSNREAETGYRYDPPPSPYGRPAYEDEVAKAAHRKQLATLTKAANICGFKGTVRDGHGEFLAGCQMYQHKGFSLAEVSTHRGRDLSAKPLSPVFNTPEELIDHLRFEFSDPITDENALTGVGEAIWHAFQIAESIEDDLVKLIIYITRLDDPQKWWGWTHAEERGNV